MARLRTSSAAKLASTAAVARSEIKRKKSVVLTDVVVAGSEKSLELGSAHARRRMSLLAAEAAGSVEDAKDDHHDGCVETRKDPAVEPSWQQETRGRGASAAQEVAGLVKNKTEVKRRGSMLAVEATKQAIFIGSAAAE